MREATYPGYLSWLDKNEWTDREASCLLVGYEPPEPTDHDAWEKIVHHDPRQRLLEGIADMWRPGFSTGTEPAPTANNDLEKALGAAADLWQRIQGDIGTGKLHRRKTSLKPGPYIPRRKNTVVIFNLPPAKWINWAEAEGIEIPEPLRKAEESRRSNVAANETTEKKGKRLAQRKQTLKAQGNRSFLKQICGEEGISMSGAKQLIKAGESKNK